MDPKHARSVRSAYIRMRLKKEEQEHGRGYQAEVARRTGLSTAHVANIMNRPHQGVGEEAVELLAKFWGMTSAQLTDMAREWAKDQPPPSSRSTPTQANLIAALNFMRGQGEVPDDVVETAVRVGKVGGDFSVPAWIGVLHDLLAMRAGLPAKPALPAPPAPASPPLRRKRPTS